MHQDPAKAQIYSRELLVEDLNPQKFGYSQLMAAIVGVLLGHDYNVRDSRGGKTHIIGTYLRCVRARLYYQS